MKEETVAIPRKVLKDIVDQLDRVLKLAEGEKQHE